MIALTQQYHHAHMELSDISLFTQVVVLSVNYLDTEILFHYLL